MGSFKIIALKTGNTNIAMGNWLNHSESSVSLKYNRNLADNTVYRFYSNYSFPKNDFTLIQRDVSNEVDLYNLDFGNKKIPVSINAMIKAVIKDSTQNLLSFRRLLIYTGESVLNFEGAGSRILLFCSLSVW